MMNEKYFNIGDIIKEMHICEDDQTNHFASKLKPGDRVLVRVPYFMDHHICVPALFNRYGTISEIKYEGYCESTGINVSYNVKMDNGIDLVINDPTDLIRIPIGEHGNDIKKVEYQPHFNYPLPYDLFDMKADKEIDTMYAQAIEAMRKYSPYSTKLLKKEKQMDNMSIYKVIFNDPATIILWNTFHYEDKECEINGIKAIKKIRVRDKTVVKCAKGEEFNKYNGFCAAVTKRIFETNSAIHRIIENATDDSWQVKRQKLVQEIVNTGKKVKAQRENMKRSTKKNG